MSGASLDSCSPFSYRAEELPLASDSDAITAQHAPAARRTLARLIPDPAVRDEVANILGIGGAK